MHLSTLKHIDTAINLVVFAIIGLVGQAGGMFAVLLVTGSVPGLVGGLIVALAIWCLMEWACAETPARRRDDSNTPHIVIGQGDYQRRITLR